MRILIEDSKGNIIATGASNDEIIKELVSTIEMYRDLWVGERNANANNEVYAGESINEAINRCIETAALNKSKPVVLRHNDTILRVWHNSDPKALYAAWAAQNFRD